MVVGFVFLLITFVTRSQADIFEKFDPDINERNEGMFEDEVWKEAAALLPALPEQENLIVFPGVAAFPQYRYAIDASSLKHGKDGVIRFVIQIRSPSGASNSYFQGLNCSEKEIKTYAYASSSSKKFIPYSNPKWQRLKASGAMGYSQNLYDAYFCSPLGIPLSETEIISNLKYQQAEHSDSIF